MPTYKITAPDGKSYNVNAPEGATREQALQKFQSQYVAKEQPPVEQPPVEQPPAVEPPTTALPQATAQPSPYQHPSDRAMSSEQTNQLGETIKSGIDSARSLGSGIVKGGMDILDMPANVLNIMGRGTADIIGLPEESRPDPIMRTSEIPAIKDFVERATAPVMPKGENIMADMLRTGGEWAVPLGKFGKPEALMGAGAAIGEQIGGETGELAGGMAGLVAALRGKKAPPKVDEFDKARTFIMENAENPTQAIANLDRNLQQGTKGTLGDLTEDFGIMKVENAASPKMGSSLQKTMDARKEQIVEQTGDVLGGQPAERAIEQAADVSGKRIKSLEKTIANQEQKIAQQGEQQLTQARALEEKSLADLDPGLKPSQASKELSGTYEEGEKAFRANVEKPAWDEFSGGEKLEVTEVLEAPTSALDNMNPTDLNMLEQEFGKPLSLIRKWSNADDGMVAPDEVHSVISQIKAINNNARKNNTAGPSNKLLGDLQISLEDSLKGLGDQTAYDNAVAATKLKNERFKPGKVGQERGKRVPETLGARLLDTNESGAAVADLINAAESPYINKKAEQYIKSVIKRDGLDDAFMANYDELLDRFPKLKGQLQQARTAQEGVVSAEGAVEGFTKKGEKQASQLGKTLSKRQVSEFNKNPETFLDNALTSYSAKDLTKLKTDLSKVEGGGDKLKQAVTDRVLNKIKKPRGGDASVPLTVIDEFNKVKRNLIDAEILTKDEVIKIEDILDRTKTDKLRKAAGQAKIGKADSAIIDMVSSGGALASLSMLPASNQLMLAGTIRRLLKNKLTDDTADTKTLLALENMITDPEKFLSGVAKQEITTEKQLSKYLDTFIRTISQSVADDKDEE